MKVSDYVVQILVENGIRDLFLVSGGAIMHLLDSVGNNRDIRYYCNYHEQACAVAAEGYLFGRQFRSRSTMRNAHLDRDLSSSVHLRSNDVN